MCKELLQYLSCSHTKRICITPCTSLASPLPFNKKSSKSPGDVTEECPFFSQQHLPQSRYPCLGCYLKPEYARNRQAWMAGYAMQHPNTKIEDVERLCGIGKIPERVGLVNVMREMDGMTLDGRDGAVTLSAAGGSDSPVSPVSSTLSTAGLGVPMSSRSAISPEILLPDTMNGESLSNSEFAWLEPPPTYEDTRRMPT
ncbi:hypothetical protein GQ43DRAFT_477358 [Delitschia confertaspora ATCC 74209]|uniref:Uncharacterized protein n=1 Tax=Delitschia confertaspora ATCC 74209 TaxID=1513339 RepID=A0A9P4MWU7_9PLEO|nr:hypothetical protein GQ43DRAFT_477358 [Delitschia confertaspora ATCC 74209]